MSSINELISLSDAVSKVKHSIQQLQKYKSNQHYKKMYESEVRNLNRLYKFFKASVTAIGRSSLNEKMKQLESILKIVLSDNKYDKKLKAISDFELFWPDLEIEFNDMKLLTKSLEIPKEIPKNEQWLDLDEAIRANDNDCYLSSLVLCRRAYEGTLVDAFRRINKRDPLEDMHCNKCGAKIRSQSYIGIVKLHNWAIENDLITDKLKQIGFLISDIGAGGAHPPLKEFPRDEDLARLAITATITMLKQIYTKI